MLYGTLFLFLLVVLSGGFAIYYLVTLRLQSRNVLKANYESLEFAHKMQKGLDSILSHKILYIDSFNKELQHQESNITEQGEAESTKNLRQSFNQLKTGDSSAATEIRYELQHIISLNMQAIENKYAASEASAEQAMTFLITIVSIISIIGFTFVMNFPSIITSSILKLTEAIKEIGQKNYHHRIHIDSKDEFGELANSFNEMTERLEYFESSNLNKIIFEKSRAEAVINSLKDASIGIDKNEVVLFVNNQAMQLLGMQAKDIIGSRVDEVSKRNDLFKFLLEEKGSTPFKIVADNRENYFTKETIDIAQDGSNSKVIVLKNITSFKELDAAKTNFIATVSHELKTPLASSDLSLKLLEDNRIGKLSIEQEALIQRLKQDNQRMLRILSELLNMSQVEAGKIQLNIQAVNPYQIIESSIQTVATSANERSLQIEKHIEKDLPHFKADGDKTVWVLNNFLTNAIKYAPSESLISIVVKKEDGHISFAVTDTGQGIDETYLKRIFERYFQVPGRSDKKGSGIGLAICKEFIDAMNGTVWVKSQIGEGSTFGFNLPL